MSTPDFLKMLRNPLEARRARWFLGLLMIPLATEPLLAVDSSGRAQAYYLFSLAQQAQFQSNLSEAARYLEEAIHTEDSSDLRMELAELYASMNKQEEAESEAREAVKLDPRSPAARKTLAGILFQTAASDKESESQLKESEALFQGLLDEDQAEEGSALTLAEIQRGRGDLASSAASLEKYRKSHAASPAIDVQVRPRSTLFRTYGLKLPRFQSFSVAKTVFASRDEACTSVTYVNSGAPPACSALESTFRQVFPPSSVTWISPSSLPV